MKQFLITLGIVLFIIFAAVAQACAEDNKEIKREGTNFTQVINVHQSTDQQTIYTYTIKDITYPIWITKNGRCYIVRISKNGNEYKQYLPEEVAKTICAELGVEYVEKTK